MEDKTVDILKEIGLGKVEVDTYLDLLGNRVSTASEIAKRTRQHRSNVYDALKRLQHKGFITEIIIQNKRSFEAKMPRVIFDYLRQKEAELKDVLPFLENISKRKVKTETASISYGVTRVRAILQNLMDSESEVLLWGIPSYIEDILGEEFMKGMFIKNRNKKKLPTKLIYNGKFGLLKQVPNIKSGEAKYIEEGDYRTMAIVSENTVFLVVFNNPPLTIEMEGEEIYKWYKAQFEVAWEEAKKPNSLSDVFVISKKRNLGKYFKREQTKA